MNITHLYKNITLYLYKYIIFVRFPEFEKYPNISRKIKKVKRQSNENQFKLNKYLRDSFDMVKLNTNYLI